VFGVYLRLGFEHLLDFRGADHILFIAVLCAAYTIGRWRELLVLVMAFTVGHSASLAVATAGVVRVDTGLVEFLIPVTIAATAVVNLLYRPVGDERGRTFDRVRLAKYTLAVVFGLIHGLGFSNFLRLLLGDERSLFVPLLSFNVGLELAQIIVALGTLGLAFLAERLARVQPAWWSVAVSVAVGVVAVSMAVERWPW
jgi:hypothetical protein